MGEAVFLPPPDKEVIPLNQDYRRERIEGRFRFFEQAPAGLLGVEANFEHVSLLHNVGPTTGRAGAEPRPTDRNDTAGPVRCIGWLCDGRTASRDLIRVSDG